MARSNVLYVCQQCGTNHTKWIGKCHNCDNWNTLTEEIQSSSLVSKHTKAKRGREIACFPLQVLPQNYSRHLTHIKEFDRVCGGGLVQGSIVLVGGDPGIGKSTLLLQAASSLSKNQKCLYISGEEALDQIQLRAERLGLGQSLNLHLASATNINDIVATLDKADSCTLAIIDSIQTMYVDQVESSPGTVSQVRASCQELTRLAKSRGIIIIMVGHVTKEGTLAGPRVLEHMVDTVLYFEGERGHQFRILRAVKNRFGPTDEIGVFEMTQKGLIEVLNPSALFLMERQENIAGSAVFAGIEGTRPLLVEIQALVASSSYAAPKRSTVGWDLNRLSMILAVLEARCGLSFGAKDVYLNVSGGLRIQEPAADLAVAAALISALLNVPIPKDAIFLGEISLSGEIRAVSQTDTRLKEAAKLGFKKAFVSQDRAQKERMVQTSFSLEKQKLLRDLVRYLKSSALDERTCHD
jgi:DNA repair protein RadA/Sms